MDPFTTNSDEHPNLPDNDFALSHDGTLSNMLDQGLFHMDSADFSNIPRQSIEQTNISSIKQQIMSHDSLLRELEKLRQYKHDLEQENEKYKDEVVELRQKVAQNNSASSLNKLQEQINHYKALNEQLMQRVHNAEKELDNKNSQEPDKKSVKALKRDLQMKEEELATNRRLLEDSYNTLKKYKERLQNSAKNLPPSSSVGISSSKSSQNMTTEEKLEEGSWKERVLELQDKVISLQGQLSEQNSMRHRLELELNEFRTENRMLKEGGRGDFYVKEERGGVLFEEKMKETIAREGKEILEGLLKNFMKGSGENLMQVSSSPEREKVKKDKRKKNEDGKEEKKKKKNKEKREEDVKKNEEKNRVLDSSFEKIEKKIKGENEEILERNENKEEKKENMIEEFNDEDGDDIFGDFLDSVNQEAGGVEEEMRNKEFGVIEETVQEDQLLALEERKESDEIEIEEKEQEYGKIEEEPINDNFQSENQIETNEIVSEEPIMKIEEPETLVKEPSQPENIQQEAQQLEHCKEDLEQLNQIIQELLTEKKKKSRSELVENSFELLLRLYLCRFEAPKYFAQEDMKYCNQRHQLIEVLIQALDTEDLSDIAMKLIDIFVQLAKTYRLFSIAYAFWKLVQDFSNFNSSKIVLDSLAGALYNFLFLPYISKKEREGFNTQLQDLNCTEKRHFISFLKDILNIPLANEQSFSGLEKLNIFEGSPLKAMLLVVVLSIYQVCNKPLLVLEIVIDLISYQFSDGKSRCNLLFVALSICWKFLKTNLCQPCDKFIIKSSTLHYLFNLKFLPLAEDHPNIFNLDFVFTAIKSSVLIAFDKLHQEDSTQTLKLEILANKFLEQIENIPLTKLDQDFERWLPAIYQTERFKNLDFQNTVPLKNIYIDPSKPTVSCFYNFIIKSLESFLEAEKHPLSNETDPSELYLEVKFNVADVVIGLHIISSIFAQTEWCDLTISKALMKYIETATGSLQKVLTIIGTGLLLPNVGNEQTAESVKEKLIRIGTSKGEGEDNMFDVVASFGVLANYNPEVLRENLEEVRLDERVVSYLDKDALDIYCNQ